MAERGIGSPYGARRPKEGSGAAGPMHRRELLQPRDIDNRKGWLYGGLGLFSDYRIRRFTPRLKALPT